MTPLKRGESRDTLENMATTIREHVTLTARMLQQLEENGGWNGSGAKSSVLWANRI